MLSKVCSAAVSGIDAYPVEVEVNAGYGDTLIVILVNKAPKQEVGRLVAFSLQPSACLLAPESKHPTLAA